MSDVTHFPPPGWVISEIYIWLTERDESLTFGSVRPDLQWMEPDLGSVVRGSRPVSLGIAIETAGLAPAEYRDHRDPSVHFPYAEMIAMSIHGPSMREEAFIRADEYKHIFFYLIPLADTYSRHPGVRVRAIHLWPGMRP